MLFEIFTLLAYIVLTMFFELWRTRQVQHSRLKLVLVAPVTVPIMITLYLLVEIFKFKP